MAGCVLHACYIITSSPNIGRHASAGMHQQACIGRHASAGMITHAVTAYWKTQYTMITGVAIKVCTYTLG